MFDGDAALHVAVSNQYRLRFSPQARTKPRTSIYAAFPFKRHYYGRIGDFDSKEEFECACELDKLAQQNRIRFGVHDLARRKGPSFFLQKAGGRFYPYFLCQLLGKVGQPNAILIVAHKGADHWLSAEDDGLIGGLSANFFGGRGRFLMVKDKRKDLIAAQLLCATEPVKTQEQADQQGKASCLIGEPSAFSDTQPCSGNAMIR